MTFKDNTRFVDVCTGYIPHATAHLFYINLWKKLIINETRNFPKECFSPYRIYHNSGNFQSNDFPFNPNRILYPSSNWRDQGDIDCSFFCSHAYIATSHTIDVTDPDERLFFVLMFQNNRFENLESIYVFKTIDPLDRIYDSLKYKTYPTSGQLLLYLFNIKVAYLTDNGLVSLYIDHFPSIISHEENQSELYLLECYRLICELLQEPAHHLSPKNISLNAIPPDNLIKPVIHRVALVNDKLQNPIITGKELEKIIINYQSAIISYINFTRIAINRLNITENPEELNLYSLPYINEGRVICFDLRKFINDLEYFSNDIQEINSLSDSYYVATDLTINQLHIHRLRLNDLYHELETFQTLVEARLRIIQQNRSDKILFFTLFVTCVLAYFTVQNEFKDEISINIRIGILLAIVIYFTYIYYKSRILWRLL